MNEFKLVTANSIEIDIYQKICQEEEKTGKQLISNSCRIVLGIGKQGGEQGIAFYNKAYKLRDVFFEGNAIEKEIADKLGSAYNAIVENDRLDDDKIAELGDEVIGSENFAIKSSLADQSHSIEPASSSQNLGSMYVFILKGKGGAIFSTEENGCHYILTFINKLDAVIFSVIQQEIDNFPYEVVSLNSNSGYLNFLKLGYEQGRVKFRVALGFSSISTPLGFKWAKHVENMPAPSLQSITCSLAEIENGFDLAPYLVYMNNAEERNLAIDGLLKTNFTPTEEVLNSAKKMLSDMKVNTIKVEEGNDTLHHRLIFMGL